MLTMISWQPVESATDFAARVRLGETTEGLHLEFKKDLDRWKASDPNERRKGQKEFARDVCQFANSEGGTILIGVAEESRAGLNVASKIAPFEEFDARRDWMESALKNFLVPSTTPKTIVPIPVPAGTVVAINVPPSERLVTIWDSESHTIECLYRTNRGKAWLNPDEMEIHRMNTRRAAQLTLQRVLSELPLSRGSRPVTLASGVWTDAGRPEGDPLLLRRTRASVALAEPREHDFMLLVTPEHYQHSSTPTVRIPYGLLREAWATIDDKVGLFLHVRVVFRSGELSLEPFS